MDTPQWSKSHWTLMLIHSILLYSFFQISSRSLKMFGFWCCKFNELFTTGKNINHNKTKQVLNYKKIERNKETYKRTFYPSFTNLKSLSLLCLLMRMKFSVTGRTTDWVFLFLESVVQHTSRKTWTFSMKKLNWPQKL